MPIEPGSLSLGAIAGGAIGAIISHYLTKSRNIENRKIDEFNKAASKFREAFLPICIAMNPAEYALKKDLAVFLEDSFSDLRKAVIEFSDFLDSKTKSAFLDTWHEYYRHPDHRDKNIVPFLAQYSCRGLSTQKEHEMKQLVQSRIDKILEFAKTK